MNHPGCPYFVSGPMFKSFFSSPAHRGTPPCGSNPQRTGAGEVRSGLTAQTIFAGHGSGKTHPGTILGQSDLAARAPRRSRNQTDVAASLPTAPPARQHSVAGPAPSRKAIRTPWSLPERDSCPCESPRPAPFLCAACLPALSPPRPGQNCVVGFIPC